MDDLFLKRVLFEWQGIVRKNRRIAESKSLKEIANCSVNLLIFQRLVPVLFYDPLP
jgi:hypothetical protein